MLIIVCPCHTVISCDEFALYRLGSLLLDTHKFDAAVDVFQKLTETGTHCEAWLRLGQAYIALGALFFHKAEISIGVRLYKHKPNDCKHMLTIIYLSECTLY